MLRILACVFGLLVIPQATFAQSGATTIAALGASQTYGMGVPRQSAYPAQLEKMLKAHGHRVRVLNLGVNGNTTGDMLRRIGSVPRSARIVILQPGGNDWRKGSFGDREGNIGELQSRLQGQGAQVIMVENNVFQGLERGPDGQHLSPAGHQALAEMLFPQVEAALGAQ